MKTFSAAVAVMLFATGDAFVTTNKQSGSASLNMAVGAAEAIAFTALSGVVSKMNKKREELYKDDTMAAVASTPAAPGPSTTAAVDDISIPYDAAARLAYKNAGSKGDFEAFKRIYERQCVGIAKMKKCQRDGKDVPAWVKLAVDGVDLSIPYDAAAKLAYEKAGSIGDFYLFKSEYERKTVAAVAAKSK